ncbi:MAG: hypothetical protein MR327_03125, partial [Clostridiales bacterium]|nr:hypothetical protein [Clostridiales bacterium]
LQSIMKTQKTGKKHQGFCLISCTFQCSIFGEEKGFLCVKKPEEVFALLRKIGSMTVDGA